jgi:hypothetical protein
VATDLEPETSDAQEGTAESAGPSDPRRLDRRVLAALLVAVNLPIMVATVRALAGGWQPLGDNGILLVRARDVGTGNHPLLGSWTSASLAVGQDLNNPGPLYFDALAPAIRLLGPWVGLAVGVMLLNMAASSLAVVAARRISGVESTIAVAVVVLALQFSMGSELLFDVWQPNALVLPFLAFLVVATVLAAGDVAMAPWVAGVGSLLVQTHMSHTLLVLVLSLVAAGLCVSGVRRADEPVAWRRPLAWSGVVAVVAWCQPVIEELTGRGEGNLSRIVAASFDGGTSTIGWERAARLIVEISVRGPWFVRSAYEHAIPSDLDPDGPVHAVVTMTTSLIVVGVAAAALVAGGRWAARHDRRHLAIMTVLTAVSLVTGYVALATSPVNVVGVAVHQMRWLWPIAAFASATWLTTLLSLLRGRQSVQRRVVMGLTVAAMVLAAVNLPTYRSRAPGPNDSIEHSERAQELMSQLDSLEGRGTVLYDPTVLWFAEPYSGLMFAELQDRDIPFVFDDEVFIRQFGEGRRNDGSAVLRLWQVIGTDGAHVPPGAERIAYVEDDVDSVALFVEPIS